MTNILKVNSLIYFRKINSDIKEEKCIKNRFIKTLDLTATLLGNT